MRNPLHAICPYFAMFPESFVQKQLLAYSQPDDLVFDPFCGRGTTILEGLLNDRRAVGTDINPVAACVAGAKAEIPSFKSVIARIEALQKKFPQSRILPKPAHEFFDYCFAPETLQQVLFLKKRLKWKDDPVDRFIAALTLGVLHGESHKTLLCLSNRMPRTISTKPEYSVRWWKEHGLLPPERDAFEILKNAAIFRFVGEVPKKKGRVVLGDSRKASCLLDEHRGKVSLVVTSPPYLDTTDYAEDQWLRLWFLGGPAKPVARLHRDDRHTRRDLYWRFLTDVWEGSASLLQKESHIVIRIGGTLLDKADLFSGVSKSLEDGLTEFVVKPLHNGETSTIKKRQTNSFRPGTSPEKLEHDFTFALVKKSGRVQRRERPALR